MSNKARYFKSVVLNGRTKLRYLHVELDFVGFPVSYDYEVYGNDNTRIESSVICTAGVNKIISFPCNLGRTYFIKVKVNFRSELKEYFLFYKMEEDIEEQIRITEMESDEEEQADEQEVVKEEELEEICVDNGPDRKINTGLNIDLDNEIDFGSL